MKISEMEKYTEPITGSELVPVVISGKNVTRKAYATIEG